MTMNYSQTYNDMHEARRSVSDLHAELVQAADGGGEHPCHSVVVTSHIKVHYIKHHNVWIVKDRVSTEAYAEGHLGFLLGWNEL